jgi:WD40 repeat protein/DNA-binding SARP family transcriptional activator/energy-coupling factor transporter ATP-binding protein EcfA2
MEFLMLGPIAVRSASGDVALGGNKPRAVLAVLLLNPNRPVSAERLALALWGEDAPGGAVKTVQVHVSRLRKALGDPDVVTTTRAGYVLRVRQGELDAERFEALVEDARQAMADGLAEDASAILREALALWRGPALAELNGEPFALAEIARLHEQRLTALELRVEADLASGRHAEIVGELRQLVADHPIREELAAQLMLALYRCGRQTEALEAYARARRALVEEMGIEPGPRLRARHEAILRQDAALGAEPASEDLPAALDPASAQPLVGRDDELERLLARWDVARNGGGGGLVALTGPRGAGKTRLAAELARTAHRSGVTVLHCSGDGPADSILVALRRVREAARPTLLVIDDADRAGEGVQAEVGRLAPLLAGASALVVAIAAEAGGLAHLRPSDAVELGPLGTDAVQEIALRYAPEGAEVPAEWLLEASGGVPSRVHEVASQWARREAARHVGAIADRAHTGRAELRSLEAELAGGVEELQERRTRILPGSGGGDGPVVCPFKGLATFDVADARYFYGRERLVAELVARLVGSPLLAIIGPSGSGKSSVMRAGLLPALSSGVLPGSETWSNVLIRPGRRPVHELAAALADVDGDGRVVLAVDQFEETFTVCRDEAERAEFIAELVAAATDSRGRYVVVIALRADHYGRCAAYPELSALLAESNVLVGSMRQDELRRAIEEPCRRAGLHIEPELVDALLADVAREPGGLPLLSAALLELWQRRDGRRLRHRAYAQTGGVHGAVARLAEDAFAQLDERQQAAGRTVLMRLVGGGEGDAIERRRVALDELEIGGNEDLARAVALLTDRRLLTVGAGDVELAHEALLREWPRLRGWIDEDRDGLRIHRALGIAAEEWGRLHRDRAWLYRGARLSEAREWRDASDPALNELERAFLQAGEAELERERTTRRRRMTLVLAALSIGLVAALGAAIFSNRERQIATSRELATKSATLVGIDPGVALEVARMALRHHDTEEAKDALRQAALEDRATTIVRADKAETTSVAASPDGSMVVSGGGDGRVRLWRSPGLHAVRTLTTHATGTTSVAFSPDGASVASAGRDGSISLTALSGGPARKLVAPPAIGDEQVYRVVTAGGVVVAGTTTGGVWIFPAGKGAKSRVLGRLPGGSHAVVAISPDAGTVFSANVDGDGLLQDVRTGARTAVSLRGEVAAASFRRDGKRVVVVGPKGVVRVLDASTGAKVADLEMGDRLLFSVDFSRDGRRIVTAGDDHVVQIADVENGQQISAMAGGSAEHAAYAADGRVVSAGADGTLQEWTPLEVKTPLGHPTTAPFTFPSFGGDGRMVVSGDFGGPVHLWELSGRELTLPGDASGVPVAAAFSPDGAYVASAGSSDDGPVRVFDVKAGRSRTLRIPAFGKYAVAMGKPARVAVAGNAQAVGVFPIVLTDADGTHAQRLTGHTDWIDALAFDQDGTHLVSGSFDGTARIWDLATGKLVRTIHADAQTVRWVAYSPDGKRVVTAGADGTIRIWPVGGGDPVVLFGHEGPVNTAVFNHRGDRIVSTGLDGTVRVWDAVGGDTLVVLVRHRGTDGAGAAFSPDDRYVVSSGVDGLRITRCEACDSFTAAQRLADTRAAQPLDAAKRKRLGLHG